MAKSKPPKLATPTDLPTNEIATVADALNGILADSFALYLKTKNFHWHVSGPHFRDYHLLLDDQATQILETTTRSPSACARPATPRCGRSATSRGASASATTMRASSARGTCSRNCATTIWFLSRSLHEAKDIVDAAKDNATSGILDEWTDFAERRAWFLFEAAQEG